MKKLFAAALAAIMIVGLFPAALASEDTEAPWSSADMEEAAPEELLPETYPEPADDPEAPGPVETPVEAASGGFPDEGAAEVEEPAGIAEEPVAPAEETPATDGAEGYGLWVTGTQVTSANAADIRGDGLACYDASTKTLTLKGDITYSYTLLYNPSVEGLTVVIEKDLTLTLDASFDDSYTVNLVAVGADTAFTGPGRLTVRSKETGGSGIYSYYGGKTLTFRDISVVIDNVRNGICGVVSPYSNTLAADNAAILVTATDSAISDFRGGIELTGCELVDPEGGMIRRGMVVDKYEDPTPTAAIGVLIGISIDDTQITSANCADVFGDGVFCYDMAAKTLTVKGSFSSKRTGTSIENTGCSGLTIFVAEDSVLTDPISLRKDTTVTGPGTLTIRSQYWAALTVQDAVVTLDGASLVTQGSLMGKVGSPKLVVKDSTLTAAGTGFPAVCAFTGGITLEGCHIETPEGGMVSGNMITDRDGGSAANVLIVPGHAPGDVNGSGTVDQADAVILLQYVSGIGSIDPAYLSRADCDGANGITVSDAAWVLRRAPQKSSASGEPQ